VHARSTHSEQRGGRACKDTHSEYTGHTECSSDTFSCIKSENMVLPTRQAPGQSQQVVAADAAGAALLVLLGVYTRTTPPV